MTMVRQWVRLVDRLERELPIVSGGGVPCFLGVGTKLRWEWTSMGVLYPSTRRRRLRWEYDEGLWREFREEQEALLKHMTAVFRFA